MSRTELEKEYELRGLSGSGASALVYKAVHKASGEEVAIKEFPGGSAPFSSVLQELSFLFSTEHPHLVSCRNLIYGGYGKSYLVMEYARGGSLRDLLLREGSLSADESLLAVEQVLEGLAYLHSRGITHCDLKPENILCFPSEEPAAQAGLNDTRLKIADFGVSVWAWKQGRGPSLGSPVYMAPEQFYDQVRPASDLYSVGAILFELASGQFLFDGDPSQLFTQHLKTEPCWELLEDSRLEQLCRALLKKDPSERPQDAESALRLLRSLLGRKVVSTMSDTWDWFSLDFVKQSADQTVLRLPAPGATACFALPNGDFLLSHRSGTDLLRPSQGRLSPNRLLEPTLAMSEPQGDGSVYLASPGWIGHFTAEGKWTPLFRPMTRIRALEFCAERRAILMADCKNLALCSVFGDLIIGLAVSNYFLSPALAISKQGFFVTSGPTQPACLVCETKDTETSHYKLPLPEPALACTMDENRPVVVTFGTSSNEKPQLLRLNEAREWEVVEELPAGLLGARFQNQRLVARYEDRVVTARWDGSHQVSHPVDGTPLDAVWNFRSQLLTIIQRTARAIEVVVRAETADALLGRAS